MPQYRIIKQGYMLKEPPYSKRGVRKVRNICSYARVSMRRDRRAARPSCGECGVRERE